MSKEPSKEALAVADCYTVTAKDRCVLALFIDALCAERVKDALKDAIAQAAADKERIGRLEAELSELKGRQGVLTRTDAEIHTHVYDAPGLPPIQVTFK